MSSRPMLTVPHGACDTHIHIYDDTPGAPGT
jgi:hypothetical protein